MTKVDDTEMAVVRQALSAVVPLEPVSEDNLVQPLVQTQPATPSAVPAQTQHHLGRTLQVALVAAAFLVLVTRTRHRLVVFSGHRQPLVLPVACLGQRLKVRRPLSARREPLPTPLGPAKLRASLPSLAALVVGSEAARRVVVYLALQLRPDLEQTNRHKARTHSVPLALRINRLSKVRIKTNQEVFSEVEDSEVHRHRKHSRRVACSVLPSLRLVGDCLVVTRLGKARPGLEGLTRTLVEVSLVHLPHNRSRVCLVGQVALGADKLKAQVDFSVLLALPLNKQVSSEAPAPTMLVVSSIIHNNSSPSPAFSEPPCPIQPLKTTVCLAGSRLIACSTPRSRHNRYLNSPKRFIPPCWMAILMVNLRYGQVFPRLHLKILDRWSHLYLPVSA